MRVLILSSCTGQKAVHHRRQLTRRDFRKGAKHLAARQRELADWLLPAEELYTGQQHKRLMRGVHVLRTTATVDVHILSAGYGIVPGNRKLAPYECTFTGMKAKALRGWAEMLGVRGRVRSLLAERFDLCLILLGGSYLEACDLNSILKLGGPTLLLCGNNAIRRLPTVPHLRPVPLTASDAARFHCGLVGLKGEVAGRWLGLLAENPRYLDRLTDSTGDPLALAESPKSKVQSPKSGGDFGLWTLDFGLCADRVIALPDAWKQRSRNSRLRYFIPDWDDLVDPNYDFLNDRHSQGRGHWSNNVYAHQLYPEPNCDGILVSRLVAEQSRDKSERIHRLGVHRFFRVPADFPILGDCGAFGYIDLETPPYETGEILDYYTRLGFDYGVSIDHMIVASTESKRRQRYELTIQNAEDFLREHRKRGLHWMPIGAVQGWDAASYAAAARKYVKMGYRYLGLGSLVRRGTPEILEIVRAVRATVPAGIRLHLFGLARFNALHEFAALGVTSLDSASALRRAWLGSDFNYLTADGWYSAIRVPQSDGCFRARRLIESGQRTADQLRHMEKKCLGALRAYGAHRTRLSAALLDHLTEYDTLLAGERRGTRERIRRTLVDRPWEQCGCAICARWGIEVAIFRGNNRNRRRGFHNTCVFYQLLNRILAGERMEWINSASGGREPAEQTNGDGMVHSGADASRSPVDGHGPKS